MHILKKQRPEKHETLTTHLIPLTMGLLWIGLILLVFLHRKEFSVDSILEGSPESMALSALMMLSLFALKSLTVVLYSGILYIASGILFPLPAAILVNVLGTVVMLTLPYVFGRLLGRRMLTHIRDRYPKAAALAELRRGSDFTFSLIVHVVNLLPTDLVSLYMGAAGLRYAPYILGGVLGLLPTAVLFPITGMSITEPASPAFLISVALEVLITLISLAVSRRMRKK